MLGRLLELNTLPLSLSSRSRGAIPYSLPSSNLLERAPAGPLSSRKAHRVSWVHPCPSSASSPDMIALIKPVRCTVMALAGCTSVRLFACARVRPRWQLQPDCSQWNVINDCNVSAARRFEACPASLATFSYSLSCLARAFPDTSARSWFRTRGRVKAALARRNP